MKEVLLVFLGGGLGSSLRWLINKIIPSDTFPYSTISVNLIGCLLIGILAGYLLSLIKGSDFAYAVIKLDSKVDTDIINHFRHTWFLTES